MYRTIWTIVLLMFCKLGYCQTYSSTISDNDIYNFLSWLKSQKEFRTKESAFNNKVLSWKEENFHLLDSTDKYPQFNFDYIFKSKEGTDTIFREHDREYLYKQFISIKDTVLRHPFTSNSGYDIDSPKHSVSIPLFSLKKDYVIIKLSYYCGNECGYGGYNVYKRLKRNKWKYVTTVNGWIS